ncbi:membrane protein insertase YidC [uncultured Oscillibacter sp.]|uniref:membrane protein insertase YidC n=1 Tax=uncultured Oscillibacter sp. TaxID=876091 RepID=UPI00280B2032|nr:membrane protein insertase YidC [uncultured Oscillibacter sp.]
MGFFGTIGYFICIPFAALLRLFYNLTGSYGFAIILFTLVIKLILLPFQMKSKKSMVRMSRMSGKMKEIQKKYANNQAKMNEEMQKFYAEEGVNPMSGCLWSFLPLPILLALYSIIRQPITHFMMLGEDVVQKLVTAATAAGVDMSAIVQMKDGAAVVVDGVTQLSPYGQIGLAKVASSMPELTSGIDGWINMNYSFLGLDLSATPWSTVSTFAISGVFIGMLLIPLLAGGSQLLFSHFTMKQQPGMDGPGAGSTKTMMYMMPLMSVYFAFIMPAALGVYWIAQSLISMVQELIMGKFYNKKLEEEETARYEARQADRQRRMEEGRRQQEKLRQEPAPKMTLKEKQRAAQEAKATKKKITTSEAGRIGDRPYARGRSYKADRYDSEQ